MRTVESAGKMEPVYADTRARQTLRKAEQAGLKSTHRQKVYHFASAENRVRFEQEPGRYVKKL
jgi:YHS domain-containing protein